MKKRTIAAIILATLTGLIAVACGGGGASSGNDKTIKSTTSNGLTISLVNSTGEAKSGENDIFLVFTDASGKPVDVGAASLKFHMPGMGSMAEMNDAATLTTTGTPGRYKAHINVEMDGSWEARVSYQGSQGTGQATMNVTVK
jgi:hypothetical protein